MQPPAVLRLHALVRLRVAVQQHALQPGEHLTIFPRPGSQSLLSDGLVCRLALGQAVALWENRTLVMMPSWLVDYRQVNSFNHPPKVAGLSVNQIQLPDNYIMPCIGWAIPSSDEYLKEEDRPCFTRHLGQSTTLISRHFLVPTGVVCTTRATR